MSKFRYATPIESVLQTQEPCSCSPLGAFTRMEISLSEPADVWEAVIPIAPALNSLLQTALANHFSRLTPFSLLLLYVTQFERLPMPPTAPTIYKWVSCHAPAGFLEQVVHPVRRTLRASDLVLLDEHGSGAALLFPQVDQMGMARILERVSHSINLLQAETVIPPLRQQTEIVLGCGSYPEPASSLDALLAQVGRVRERVVFRPAVLSEPAHPRTHTARHQVRGRRGGGVREKSPCLPGIPFMQIPSRLPSRLKQLVPHALALELRCAPVGRDHNRLTVAMADPANTHALGHLREITGMTIFPVSCDPSALETLLASHW